MASELAPIDISRYPELLKLVEDVRNTERPRVLSLGGEEVAVLIPVEHPPKRARRAPTAADIEAAWATFGSWADEDVEAFLLANEESRRIPPSPPVDL